MRCNDSRDDCVAFLQYGVSASHMLRTGWGLWQPVSSHPQRAGWLLCAGEPLCCVPQLQLGAGSLWWSTHTGAAHSWSKRSVQNTGFTVIKDV